jgi:hypothetical protein
MVVFEVYKPAKFGQKQSVRMYVPDGLLLGLM